LSFRVASKIGFASLGCNYKRLGGMIRSCCRLDARISRKRPGTRSGRVRCNFLYHWLHLWAVFTALHIVSKA